MERAADDDEDEAFARGLRGGLLARLVPHPAPRWVATRYFILRGLGFIYFVAFFSLALQVVPLLGADGLLPVHHFMTQVLGQEGTRTAAFFRLPSIFWLSGAPDRLLVVGAWLGVGLAFLAMAGVTNAVLQAVLWFLYMSYVHVGQVFWGYGWELLLLEAGFLAIFLCPLREWRPLPDAPPPVGVIWLYRFLVFRVMFGAGLIKLRGDPCWVHLTCLEYHYTTQPLPNPASWLLAQAPPWFDQLGVLFNHLVEIVAPWFVFGPRRARHVAGGLIVVFQSILIVSGNLSFLNWLTIVCALSCFDDALLARLLPATARLRAARIAEREPSPGHRRAGWALVAVVLVLSVQPMVNLISPRQIMNGSFDRFDLVNTYGAFGTVNEKRYEVVLEGTADRVLGPQTRWRAWELPCKPGDPGRMPCIAAPYQPRLDWQMWFAALSDYAQEPWIVHLTWKLLEGDRTVQPLFANDPFPHAPPRWVRASFYSYRFTRFGDGSRAWWTRTRIGDYLTPVRKDDPRLHAFLRAYGWK